MRILYFVVIASNILMIQFGHGQSLNKVFKKTKRPRKQEMFLRFYWSWDNLLTNGTSSGHFAKVFLATFTTLCFSVLFVQLLNCLSLFNISLVCFEIQIDNNKSISRIRFG